MKSAPKFIGIKLAGWRWRLVGICLCAQAIKAQPLKFKTTGRIYSEFISKPQLGRSQPSYHFGLIFAWSSGCSLLLLCAAWATLAAVLLHQQAFGSWFSALDFFMSVRATFFSCRTLALARHMDVLFAELQWVQFWKRSFWNYYYDCYFPTFIFLWLEVLLPSEIVLMHCEPTLWETTHKVQVNAYNE